MDHGRWIMGTVHGVDGTVACRLDASRLGDLVMIVEQLGLDPDRKHRVVNLVARNQSQ